MPEFFIRLLNQRHIKRDDDKHEEFDKKHRRIPDKYSKDKIEREEKKLRLQYCGHL